MTYEEAVAYLEGLIDLERSRLSYENQKMLKLDRVATILEKLGNPHHRLSSIHVAGTKGKGSTCAFVESVLRAAGYRVGLYTSPGLVDFRERIMIDRCMIGKDDVAEAVERLMPCIETIDIATLGEVTYFEAMTVLALDYFASQNVDFVVLEVGMGGRLDATNVVVPLACAITPVSFDHTRSLGHTLAEIAFEKAGIIKPGVPVASGFQQDEAAEVIRKRATEMQAPLIELGQAVFMAATPPEARPQRIDISGLSSAYKGLEVAMAGGHQASNATLAVAVCDLLQQQGVIIPEQAVRTGLRTAGWPGRLQVIRERPTLLIDGAHTPESARSLVGALKSFPHRRLILIFGISADKDISGVWRVLERAADMAYLCKSGFYSNFVRSAEPETVRQMIYDTNVILRVEPDPARALESALQEADPDDLICVTGSFYLIGDILKILGIPAQQEAPESVLEPARLSEVY